MRFFWCIASLLLAMPAFGGTKACEYALLHPHFLDLLTAVYEGHEEKASLPVADFGDELADAAIAVREATKKTAGSSLFSLQQGMPDPYSKEFYEKKLAPRYYADVHSPMQRYFSLLAVASAMIKTSVSPRDNLHVIDLGAGRGDTTYALKKLLPHSSVTAIDRSVPMLKDLKTLYAKVTTIEHDFEQLPLPVQSFSQDWVVSICSAGEYLSPDAFAQLLDELRRVLRPGGLFILEFGPPEHTTAAPRGYDVNRFSAWIRKTAGFELVDSKPLTVSAGETIYSILVLRKK